MLDIFLRPKQNEVAEKQTLNAIPEGTNYTFQDLAGHNFNGEDVTGALFDHAKLEKVTMEHVRIGQPPERVDLTKNTVHLGKPDIWKMGMLYGTAGICDKCETRMGILLGMKGDKEYTPEREHRGVILYWKGHPLGFLKLWKQRNFVALRTVETDEGTLFHEGMIYALPPGIEEWLQCATEPFAKANQWRRADVEDIHRVWNEVNKRNKSNEMIVLGRNPLRMLIDPRMYPVLEATTRGLEDGSIPTIRIPLTEENFKASQLRRSAARV